MRAYVVVFCVVALAAVTLASPRRTRQAIPDDNDISFEDPPAGVSNQWGWGGNGNGNRPTRPTRPTRPSRPTRPTRPTPTPTPMPTQPPSPSPPSQAAFDRCMRNCLRTPQYDPLCASLRTGLRKTYTNSGERMCAEFCGENSTILYRGSCSALT